MLLETNLALEYDSESVPSILLAVVQIDIF
jgi:hypothetical protein